MSITLQCNRLLVREGDRERKGRDAFIVADATVRWGEKKVLLLVVHCDTHAVLHR